MTLWILGDDFRDSLKDLYTTLYRAGVINHTVDAIPYTEDFEIVYQRIVARYPVTRHEVHSMLMTLRKSGELPGPRKDREERPLLSS